MTTYAEVFDHVGPWDEADFLVLPDDSRFELLDGALVVRPLASRSHQRVTFNLVLELYHAAPPGLEVSTELNVRVRPVSILRPDLVIVDNPGGDENVVDASHVVLVGEVTSPSNAGIDRLVKPQVYAAAGIAYYLRVDLADAISGAPGAVLYRLRDGQYREIAAAAPGQVLSLTEPFAVDLDLAVLARRTRPPSREG